MAFAVLFDLSMRVVIALCVVATACHAAPDAGDPDASGPPDASVAPPDAWVDQAGPLFAPDHVVEVAITMAPGDWIALGDQTRTIPMLFSTCGAGPYPDPFTYFHAGVTIDGTTFADVGVRKKGFLGSMDTAKPSLKIKLDEYVDHQSIYGEKGLTLNNAKQDAALIRTCMSYHVFTAAGIAAPRCNFAHVTVNGAD